MKTGSLRGLSFHTPSGRVPSCFHPRPPTSGFQPKARVAIPQELPDERLEQSAEARRNMRLSRKNFRKTHALFTRGNLMIGDQEVMAAWERPYMKVLAAIACRLPYTQLPANRRAGKVLEVGFGMGISADYIQKHKPQEHVIIEAHPEVYAKAVEWAREQRQKAAARWEKPPNIHVIHGFWEDVVPKLRSNYFTGILFDTYPLSFKEVHRNHYPFIPHAHRILATDGVFTYYSDEIDTLSRRHQKALQEAGFIWIGGEPVRVKPPKECKYWKHQMVVAPFMLKSIPTLKLARLGIRKAKKKAA